MSHYGAMHRSKLQHHFDKERRMRRMRRFWYDFMDGLKENGCLLMWSIGALGLVVAGVFLANDILRIFR